MSDGLLAWEVIVDEAGLDDESEDAFEEWLAQRHGKAKDGSTIHELRDLIQEFAQEMEL